MKKFNFIYLFFFFFSFNLFSQNIVNSKFNNDQLNILKDSIDNSNLLNKLKIEKLVKSNTKIKNRIYKADGTFDELVSIENNKPIYYSIDNINAAKATRTNFLNNLNLNGNGLFVGVWDGGPARISHQEFENRLNVFDGSSLNTNSFHGTHVSGTIAAKGINTNAKGMANKVEIRSFDWFSDTTEVIAQIQQGMLVSNHSYGTPIQNVPGDYFIGGYTNTSRVWDLIANNAPYYLMVASAGNNGTTANPNPIHPGFDKLTGNKVSKNNLVIANGASINTNANGDFINASIASSSSQGPSDDRRIKPDITGLGTSILSTGDANDTQYITLSGTSMSAPNVSGTLILLQEFYNSQYSSYMKAATLKGLVCHTADDAGNPGPDAIFGWGVLNAKKASEAISFNGLTSLIKEDVLSNNQTKTYVVKSIGTQPLIASISWNDPAGIASENLNSSTPNLVNDLDIRITKNAVTSFPWRLQSNPSLNATRNSDNNVDNVEIIKIDSPTNEDYTITVSHKGNLQNSQPFSLVVTGLNSTFSLIPINEIVESCNTSNASYNFNFKNLDFNSATLSVSGLPAGVNHLFSENPLSTDTNVNLTLSNLTNLSAGTYNFQLNCTKGTDVITVNLVLKVFSNVFTNMNLTFPADAQNYIAQNVTLKWNQNSNAKNYKVQLSNQSNFSSLLIDVTTTELSYYISNLNQNQTYYWRILPSNNCGTATNSTIYSFVTGTIDCNNNYVATDFSTATIGTGGFSTAIIPINITENKTISAITVEVQLSHPSINELKIFLESPTSLGSKLITLYNNQCGSNPNINASFNDGFPAIVCNTSSPALSGNVKSFQLLNSQFSNKIATGIWKLIVLDEIDNIGGLVSSAKLNICAVNQNLSNADFDKNNLYISIYPNPAQNILNFNTTDNTIINSVSINDISGKEILRTNNVSTNSLDVSGLQAGVYFVKFTADDKSTVKKFIKE
jgi:subtilisin family serine protease